MNIGIDFGTTNSLSAHINDHGQVVIIPDFHYRYHTFTPSCIIVLEKEVLIGHQALRYFQNNPKVPILTDFKAHIGSNKIIYKDSVGREWYAEGLVALMLRKLKLEAEMITGEKVTECILTLPAHYDDIQKKQLLIAAGIADLKVQSLLEEPVAAAIYYGAIEESHKDKTFLVYDMGGGTFDASIIVMNDKGIYVLAKSGDNQLGGRNIDNILFEYFLPVFSHYLGDISDWSVATMTQAMFLIRDFKLGLCTSSEKFFSKSYFISETIIELSMDSSYFKSIIAPILDKADEVVRDAIRQSGLTFQDIDIVMLVGGSALLPGLSETLADRWVVQKSLFKCTNPQQAVALGAAIFADRMNPIMDYTIPSEFYGVSHHYLGIKTINPTTGQVEIDTIIIKNMPLPATARRSYFTHSNNQTEMTLTIVQYLSNPDDHKVVGMLKMGPFSRPRLNYELQLEIIYDKEGLIKATAFDPQTGKTLDQIFNPLGQDSSRMLKQRSLVQGLFINM
jgi:molecular chaperone DnaK (HSP70)